MMGIFLKLDDFLIVRMRQYGPPGLRVALGVVYLWFGLLKLFGASPVADLIINAFAFMPVWFILVLGVWEVGIGLCLMFKWYLRFTLFLLWLQMAGTIAAPFLLPSTFILGGNPLLLTLEGEFIVKNLIIIAAGIVVGGFEVKRPPETV